MKKLTVSRIARFMLPLLAVCAASVPACAQDTGSDAQTIAVHAQATLVAQGVGGFVSPYAGPNSLTPRQLKETTDVTVYAGVRPWAGAELWVNPEIDQGFGLSNTLGAAGFPSAEAYKVGKSAPYLRLQRLFLRQTIGLGGGDGAISAAANQLAGLQDRNRLVLTVGKFGVGDVFDTNRYAHDPRGDFLNWSVVDTGSFDYAADAWGYSYGVAAEWYQGPWTVRLGLFNLSKVPNGEVLEHDFSQNQLVGEIEHRHSIGGRSGAVRITGFRNRGRFSRFDEALALAERTGRPVDASLTRRRMDRFGIALNAEQELTATLGVFLRAGTTDGAIEPYDFTDIDRTLAVGLSLSGKGWGRSTDTFGLAIADNAISAVHKRYLAAGGIGVLVGDGQLPHPGDEQVIEAYYAWHPRAPLTITADCQRLVNPGYNRDRGPVNVFALRVHAAI
ncbi:carbohydrate porin [Novosphingobium olei]|nr:carbohydrate porin [Novosphingobium olei]